MWMVNLCMKTDKQIKDNIKLWNKRLSNTIGSVARDLIKERIKTLEWVLELAKRDKHCGSE